MCALGFEQLPSWAVAPVLSVSPGAAVAHRIGQPQLPRAVAVNYGGQVAHRVVLVLRELVRVQFQHNDLPTVIALIAPRQAIEAGLHDFL